MNEYALMLKNFLDSEGRLKLFPAKRKMKIIALCYLIGFFEDEKNYSEQEVNQLLARCHTFSDPATLRRELYDFHFLDRTPDGRIYQKTCPQPTMESLGV